MDNYVIPVLTGAAINLALLLPLFAAAWLSNRSKPAAKPILLFAFFFVLDMALIFSFRVVHFIPAWGHYNWQGKVLEAAWPVLLALFVKGYSAGRIGLTLPESRQSWRILAFTCVLYAVVGIPVALLMGAHFGVGGDVSSFAYEATMPGLGEEFVYRGVLLMLLNEAFGRPWKVLGASFGWGAVIVTAMFGFLHGIDVKGGHPMSISFYWTGMIYPAVIGVVLAWLRERTGSVWPGVLLHNFVNVLNQFLV
ncbi:MAG TPA: CPBP family intramembrane glutamic endopeptidase [Gammaproteobacteria bacterium]|nr:CPBP family intramembrane glutamic endopeptidase [Gammaproteobacteria bacterium]